MRKFIYIVSLSLLVLFCALTDVAARIDGTAEWNYAHFEQDGGGQTAVGSHFKHSYSLMYSAKGQLAGGRAGYYDLGIGGEWGGFDSTVGDQDYSNDTYKLLYNGALQIAPGALPFRLTAYSRDLTKISFDQASSYFPDYIGRTLISPNIVTDLQNGQTISSGIQLVAGIRNGRYLGRYRELMSKWPRLFVDYRDIYSRDMKSKVKRHQRDSDLAFVSLNKKDNWFHYRLYKHKDYMDPINNSTEEVLLLGTVDHLLKRQWINMTNWIKISVDGSYTELKRAWDERTHERYDVNLFTEMNRPNIRVFSALGMHRKRLGGSVDRVLSLPVYAHKRIRPNTDLNAVVRYYQDHYTQDNLSTDTDEKAYYGQARLRLLENNRFVVTPSMEVEVNNSTEGSFEAVLGRVEVSNVRRSSKQRLNWSAMSSLGHHRASNDSGGDAGLWEGELQGNADYRLTSRTRVGGEQYFLYGQGSSLGGGGTRYLSPKSTAGFKVNSAPGSQVLDGALLRSSTTIYLDHTTSSRINNRLSSFYQFEDSDVQQLYHFELVHNLNYQSRWWRIRLENFYMVGDSVDNASGNTSGSLLGQGVVNSKDEFFRHKSTFAYTPNMYWKSKVGVTYFWQPVSNSQLLQVKQELKRSFSSAYSNRRKVGEITQSLTYELTMNGANRSAAQFSLYGDYFPSRNWQLGMGVDYYYNDYSSDVLYYTLTTGLKFPLFMVDFSYRYGASSDNVVAHRYEVNVKKKF